MKADDDDEARDWDGCHIVVVVRGGGDGGGVCRACLCACLLVFVFVFFLTRCAAFNGSGVPIEAINTPDGDTGESVSCACPLSLVISKSDLAASPASVPR